MLSTSSQVWPEARKNTRRCFVRALYTAMISITTEIRCYLRRNHCWQTLFLLFKFEASKTKECFVSRTNALLVGTLSIGDVSLSIAISWKTIEGFISFGGWSIFIAKVALQIYQLSVYIAVMFSVVQNQAQQVVIALDRTMVCYTAVFSVVTQCSSPQNGEERCVTTLKTAV